MWYHSMITEDAWISR